MNSLWMSRAKMCSPVQPRNKVKAGPQLALGSFSGDKLFLDPGVLLQALEQVSWVAVESDRKGTLGSRGQPSQLG